MGAAHARVRQAQHVAHARFQQFFGNGQVAPLGHAGGSHRAGIAQHQHGVFIAIERLIGHGLEHLGLAVKDQRLAAVHQQML